MDLTKEEVIILLYDVMVVEGLSRTAREVIKQAIKYLEERSDADE